MGSFQNIVMMIAIVILIISLLVIGVMIYKERYKNIFPPVLPGCPQPGWVVDSSDSTKCIPAGGIKIPGSSTCSTIPYISGDTKADICRAYEIASDCNIPWDGISGNPQYKHQCSK